MWFDSMKNMVKKITPTQRDAIYGYELLEELALDFLSSWTRNHCTDTVWAQLEPELWEQLRNPWVVLQTVSTDKLKSLLADKPFRQMVDDLVQANRNEIKTPAWFQDAHAGSSLTKIAYFSMEYMLGEALPIYSGGLGNVAGDQLKAASDLGVPVAAIGLLYQQGYFRQVLDNDGNQKAFYPFNSPEQLPIVPLRKPNGEWLRLEIEFPGWSIWLRTWEVKVGKVRLYLLDSNDAANYPPHRGITSELYGGDSELRLKQEIILGIGGWRLLEALGIAPEVCHLNEGHAAFAILDRARSYMKTSGQPFDVALTATRSGNIFTTHTAVPAGFDRFSPFLIEQYLASYAKDKLGISIQDLLGLGRENPSDHGEYFNMAYLAVRGSGAVNGVSRLHGMVSRHIFNGLFPRLPEEESPIGHVTNGVHMPSWSSITTGNLWSEYAGKSCWIKQPQEETSILQIPNDKIWAMRNQARKELVDYSRKRAAKMLAARGTAPELVERAKTLFDPNAFTIGFARRFATYKRPNLLLHDKERLLRILTHSERPVQLVVAGKAHPADEPGQALIKEWFQFIWKTGARFHVIFMSDYDVLLTQRFVQSVDLWVNTPRRPWEACGTSGMKVLANGGINLSELDGWWAEAYDKEIGWALGDGKEHDHDPAWDAVEAAQLYQLLETEIIPEFYSRDKNGIPTKWVDRVRKSMARLTPRFSADRAVRQYTEEYYLPAAAAYKKRTANNGAVAKQIFTWKQAVQQNWGSLRFVEMKTVTKDNEHHFEVQVYLNHLDPNAIQVELYAMGGIKQKMSLVQKIAEGTNTYIYRGSVPATRPEKDYTPRMIPFFPGVAIPLETNQILWQK